MKSKLRTVISRAVYFLAITVQAATCVGDIKSDFIAAWEKRRTVAPCVRCRVERVKVIPANSKEHNGTSYPSQDVSFDEYTEHFYDLQTLRCKLDGINHVASRGAFVAHHFVTINNTSGGKGFNLRDPQFPMPNSLPSVTVNHKTTFPKVGLDPVAWGLGFPARLDQIQDLRKFPFEFQIINDGKIRSCFHVENGVYMILILNPPMDFALESSWFSRDKNSKSEVGEMLVNVTWQKLERGWFPMEWQETSGKVVSSRVTSWEFLDTLPSDTFDEPPGAGDPGNIVLTPDGFREIDKDQSLVPIGVRSNQGRFGFWLKIGTAVVVIVAICAILRFRRR